MTRLSEYWGFFFIVQGKESVALESRLFWFSLTLPATKMFIWLLHQLSANQLLALVGESRTALELCRSPEKPCLWGVGASSWCGSWAHLKIPIFKPRIHAKQQDNRTYHKAFDYETTCWRSCASPLLHKVFYAASPTLNPRVFQTKSCLEREQRKS